MFPTSNRNGPFFNDIIYTTTPHFSKQQEDPAAPFCFFHMPSPYNIPYHQELELQDSDDLLMFQQDHQQQQQPLELKNINDNNVKQHQDQEPNSQKIPVRAPKRSSCKRDRHSKINTAQGPRNRRMRLSLKVARDFFDLQDRLGFDKASKTVEWLLFQAKPEIKKIFGNHGIDSTTTSTHKINSNNTSTAAAAAAAASSASDCEAVAASVVSVPIQQYSCPKDKPKRTRMSRKKSVLFDPVARECLREKARAWARERTREKIKNRIMVEVAANHELTITSTSSSTPSFETGTGGSAHWEESAGMSHHSNMILQQQLEHESGASEELNIDADESLMMMLMMHNHHLYNLIPQDQHKFPDDVRP